MTLADVRRAAERLEGVAHRTPVVRSRTLDQAIGRPVVLKCENLQRMGAFKFRGAYNAIAAAAAADGARGVVTYSSGNHAQAVALAASLHGIPATIVMPRDAPTSKVAATRGYGGEVITYDRYREDRAAIAADLAAERDAVVVPPYDDAAVIAGQGTVALELLTDEPDVDLLVVPVGGGGLIAGCAVVAASMSPPVRVVGVEPEARTAGRDALAAGRPVTRPVAHTIADGQQTPSVGTLTHAVFAPRIDTIVGVGDAAVVEAMRFAFERLKLVVEPSGASGLAALRSGLVPLGGARRIGVVISGGNIDVERFTTLLRPA